MGDGWFWGSDIRVDDYVHFLISPKLKVSDWVALSETFKVLETLKVFSQNVFQSETFKVLETLKVFCHLTKPSRFWKP